MREAGDRQTTGAQTDGKPVVTETRRTGNDQFVDGPIPPVIDDTRTEDAAVKTAFAGAKQAHPEQEKFQLRGSTNFAFKTPDAGQWPAQLQSFLSDQFHIDPTRLRVMQFGEGKSGDFVFGVFLDGKDLGVLKVYRDPGGAKTDARILHIIGDAHIEHYQPAEEKGGISSVTIDGAPGSSLFTELVPGKSMESLIRATPAKGPEREAHLAMLDHAVQSAAVSLADLHNSMASGKQVEKEHKQNEARFIMAKFSSVRAKNDAKHFTTPEMLNKVERKLWDQVIPAFVASPLPATAYHGDAHVGNFVVNEQMQARPIDLTSMEWSLDDKGKGTQTGAVDVGQFIARLYEKSEGALTTAEADRLKKTFLDEYFKHSAVSRDTMQAGMQLYAVESQFARIMYDIGDPKAALAAAAQLLELA